MWEWVKSLLHTKFLDWSKVEGIVQAMNNVANRVIRYVSKRLENIKGKGENAGYQHFLLYPQCFQKALFFRVVNT